MKILASAKINLALDILGKTASGYHKIQTIFQEIPEIYDEIEIINKKETDHLSIIKTTSPSFKQIPLSKNLAFRALQLLKKTCKITDKFVHVTIKKNIPISSGLGGASSNAAAILKGINELWNLELDTRKLMQLAAKLGSDVPFFILGGTALGTHFGEKITPLPSIKNIKFKIYTKTSPNSQKTKNSYAKIDLKKCSKNLNKTQKLLAAIENEDTVQITENLHNDFEQIYALPKNHHLSGSGPSTFSAH